MLKCSSVRGCPHDVTGRGRAGPALEATRPLRHQDLEAVDHARAPGSAPPRGAPCRRLGRPGRRQVFRHSDHRRRSGSALNVACGSWSPTDVHLTRISAGSAARARARRARAATLARRLRCPVPDRHVGAPALRERPDHGARPRRRRRARAPSAPAGSTGSVASSPGASVLSASMRPSAEASACWRRRSRARRRSPSSASASAASLCGIVTLTPREAGARQRAHRLGEERPAGPAASGSASPSRPSAASAALCIAGEQRVRDRPAADPEPRQQSASATCRRRRRARRCSGRTSRWNSASVDEKACARRCRRLDDEEQVVDVARAWPRPRCDAGPGCRSASAAARVRRRVLYGRVLVELGLRSGRDQLSLS